MSGLQPVAVYAMRIPPGDIMVPAVPEFAAMFRLTMAAIDPSAEPEIDDVTSNAAPRATLKVIRVPDSLLDDDSDSDDDDDLDLDDLDDEDDDEEDEEINGGPSKPKVNGALEDDDEDMDDDEEDDEDDEDEIDAKTIARLTKLIKNSKGKSKAGDDDEDEDDLDDKDDLSDESLEMDEIVLCTLDPEKHYQQPLDFVVGEGEKVFFKVSGTHWVHLTGNYVIPQDDGQTSLYSDEEDEEEDYDLEPTEEELAEMGLLDDEEDESDELDDLEEPRLVEVASDEEAAPKLVKVAGTGKGKNKRPAEDSEEDTPANLDDIIASTLKGSTAIKSEPPVKSESAEETKKLSKAEKKKLKKLKSNDGKAVEAPATTNIKSEGTDSKDTIKAALANGTNPSSDKKVQFAKNLEQGPTGSPANKTATAVKTEATTTTTKTGGSVKEVQGITVDERKAGSGATAKKGSKLEMRYIGKLESGKVFDSNKSGKPFSFKLGAGDVIKGWDVGLMGIQPGGERRLIIPPQMAYGNKALPGIPKGSKLIFDIKCLSVS